MTAANPPTLPPPGGGSIHLQTHTHQRNQYITTGWFVFQRGDVYSSCALAAAARQSLYVPVKDFIFLLNIKSRLVHLRPSQPAGQREQTSSVWPPPLLQ